MGEGLFRFVIEGASAMDCFVVVMLVVGGGKGGVRCKLSSEGLFTLFLTHNLE